MTNNSYFSHYVCLSSGKSLYFQYHTENKLLIKLDIEAQAACRDFPETVTEPTDHNNVTDCVLFADRSHKPPIKNIVKLLVEIKLEIIRSLFVLSVMFTDRNRL